MESLIVDKLHSKAISLKLPLSGTFELTSRCNFNCKMCYIHNSNCSLNQNKELTTAQWLDIAKQAKDAGTLLLLLTGGEPLIRSDFPFLYEELCKMGFIIQINTNGSLITEEIFELFSEYPPSRINVSLYASDNEHYNELCGVNAFDTVTENIKRLQKMKIDVVINCVVNKFNAPQFDSITTYLKANNLNSRISTYIFPPLRNSDNEIGYNVGRLSPIEATDYKIKVDKFQLGEDAFYKKIKSISDINQFNLNECIIPSKQFEAVRCRAGKSCYWVDWQGKMGMCGMIPCNEAILETSFTECWNKTIDFSDKVRLPKKCVECEYHEFCSFCASSCYTESGSFSKPGEYVCQMTKAYAKKIKEIIKE